MNKAELQEQETQKAKKRESERKAAVSELKLLVNSLRESNRGILPADVENLDYVCKAILAADYNRANEFEILGCVSKGLKVVAETSLHYRENPQARRELLNAAEIIDAAR